MFNPKDRVYTSEKMLHGNCSLVKQGSVVSIQGSNAIVLFDGEVGTRTVPSDTLKNGDKTFGYSSNPHEMPVIDGIRR